MALEGQRPGLGWGQGATESQGFFFGVTTVLSNPNCGDGHASL